MAGHVTLGVGTQKGLFLFDGDPAAGKWKAREPILPEWEISTVLLDPREPDHMTVGTVHYAWGATVRDSRDGGKTWTQTALRPVPEGKAQPPGDGNGQGSGLRPISRIWQIVRGNEQGTLYAGVDEAALYVSRDNGESWSEVEGLSSHPSRPHWQPGAGGLCLHSIVIDPNDSKRMWVAISAVGVFGTTDGGRTWEPMNKGITPMVQTGSPDENAMFCIHRIALDPTAPGRLYMQFHAHNMTPDQKMSPGVYRSDDAGRNWKAIDAQLPDHFGFPLAVSKKGEVFVIPLYDGARTFRDGKAAVWRSASGGDSWERVTRGLDGEPEFSGVLRDAMCADVSDPAGVYFGTTGGDLFTSGDAGKSWNRIPGRLPRVLSVRAEVRNA